MSLKFIARHPFLAWVLHPGHTKPIAHQIWQGAVLHAQEDGKVLPIDSIAEPANRSDEESADIF